MKMSLKHIVAMSFAALLLLSSCNRAEEKVIPRSKLAKIYAEMLLTDQWISETPELRRVADTSLIYEPILEKYGYTKMDYLHTVDAYLDDPERFSRIWRETSDILDERLKDARARRAAMETEAEKIRKRERFSVDFQLDSIFPYMLMEPYIHYHDSLAFGIDTAIRAYKMHDVVLADTTYDGLVMNIRIDSLALADTLAAVDTLAVPDTMKQAGPVKAETAQKTIGKLKSERNLPLRQLKKPVYDKDMKTGEELKMIREK